MKKTISSITLVAAGLFVVFSISSFVLSGPKYLWNATTHDFGKIAKDKPVSVVFKFSNSGDAPLIIKDAKSGCGCTVTDYSKKAVAPNENGFVKLTFNAQKVGEFTKTVDVISNVKDGAEHVTISGEVVE